MFGLFSVFYSIHGTKLYLYKCNNIREITLVWEFLVILGKNIQKCNFQLLYKKKSLLLYLIIFV